METPLTPLAFAARARRIYSDRDATVFEGVTRSYAEFLERIDRWSKRLQEMGVRQGDRVAYIAQNMPSHLEGYYAVPQIGAVLVPINYRSGCVRFHLHPQPLRRARDLRRQGLCRGDRGDPR